MSKLVCYLCALVILAGMGLSFSRWAGPNKAKLERRNLFVTVAMFFYAPIFWWLLHTHVLPFPGPESWLAPIGVSLAIAGAGCNLLGRLELGEMWSDQVAVYQNHRLITRGIYRLVRHPMYASQIWLYLGASLVFRETTGLLLTLLVFMPIMAYRCRQEEAALRAAFPNYRSYRKKVGMLFPVYR